MRRATVIPLLIGVALLISACGAQSSKVDHSVASTWSLPNADPWGNRTVASAIDAADVSHLKVAWTLPLSNIESLDGVFSSTPVFDGGTAYLQDLGDNVYAVNERTGRLRWKYSVASSDTTNGGPNGLAVSGGVVYGETAREAFALSAATGRQLWRTHDLATRVGEGFNVAPMIAKGVDYVETSAQPNGGVAYGLDDHTGKVLWKFYESKTPARRAAGSAGAGGSWGTPVVVGGSVYVGVGNPYISINTALNARTRSSFLYNDSTVSLDARTGKLRWYYQAVPNDFHDWDMQLGPIYTPDGPHHQPTVLDSGKMGVVYAFNSTSGKLLWKSSVGLHNGHDADSTLALEGRLQRPKLPYRYCPGVLGGVETQMALAGGLVYVPVNNLCSTYSDYSSPTALPDDPTKATGELDALSLRTGRVVWRTKLRSSPYGAATVTNNLVFTTLYSPGEVVAMNRTTGRIVWTEKLAGLTNSPLAIDGNELITAASLADGPGQREEVVAYSLHAPAHAHTDSVEP
jgi:alcohol dehydrogenase (cytochrome c)